MERILDFIIENIEIVISTFALIISIFNLGYLLFTNNKKLGLEIENFSSGKSDNKDFYFFNISITNKSRLPISINELSIKNDKQVYIFIKSPRLLLEGQTTRGKEIIRKKEIYSVKFPITISGLCSEQFFAVIYGPKVFSNKTSIFTMKTSRGKIKKKIKHLLNKYINSKEFFDDIKNYN